MRGQIVHTEIPADDTAAVAGVLGLALRVGVPVLPGPSEYHMARISDTSGVAITNREPGKRGMRTYFDVDDINVGVARVTELGGEAGEAMPVPGMGWFSTCTDPHGNEFGLWQSDESAPMPAAVVVARSDGASAALPAGRHAGSTAGLQSTLEAWT